MLSLLGEWADRCRIPLLGRRRTAARPSRLWSGLVRRVVRHPLVWGGAAVLALLVLAAPAAGMRIGSPPIDLPSNLPVVQALDQISAEFPGRPAPAEVVITGRDLDSPAMRRALTALEDRASARGPLREPVTVTPVAGGRALIAQVPLAGNGSDTPSERRPADRCGTRSCPRTIGQVRGVSYAVTGSTAVDYDWSAVDAPAPRWCWPRWRCWPSSCCMVAFQSLTLPLVSIGLNLLSVGGAYGLVTLIFQDGHLQGLLGFTSYGAVSQWVPLFTFVLLFGLSMDYHVFILSRIRERWAGGASTPDAVDRRDRGQRGRGDQRRRDHGGGVLHLRHAVVHRRQDARRRAGLRGPARRHDRARDPGARGHDPAR